MVDDVRARGGCVQDLTLEPLTLTDVTALVRDTFAVNRVGVANMEEGASGVELTEVREYELALAKAVHNKTEGNPFFINQLLTTLHQDGHIYLVTKPVPHWVCNMAQIKVMRHLSIITLLRNLSRQPIIQTM